MNELLITSCGICPFANGEEGFCDHDGYDYMNDGIIELEYKGIPERCPLKNNPVLIKLKDDE